MIRPYTQNDHEAVQRINKLCFVGTECPPPETLKDMLSISDVWVNEREYEKNVTGFIITQPASAAYIWSLAVLPWAQGRGVGAALLRSAEEFYKGNGSTGMSLHCNGSNPAQKFYFNHGYRVYDLVQGYYSNGPGLLMKKSFGRVK